MCSSSTLGCRGCDDRVIRPCCSMVLSRIIMACGVTRQARASVAAVIPGCSSSSNSATYCDGVNPTDFKATLLARTIACSARLTSMTRRSCPEDGPGEDLWSTGLRGEDLCPDDLLLRFTSMARSTHCAPPRRTGPVLPGRHGRARHRMLRAARDRARDPEAGLRP